MSDHPFWDCAKSAFELIEKGHLIFQKFTCAKCGARNTMADPNKWYKTGACEDCRHITDIEAQGCNYMLLTNMTVEQYYATIGKPEKLNS